MARNYKELQAGMNPASRADNQQRVRKELQRMALEELRGAQQLTQADMAEMLDVPQSSISRIERRADMYLSTLRSYVRAAGGELQIQAVFPDGGTVVIDRFGESKERTRAMKFDSIEGIRQNGFKGFLTISALQASECREVPDEPGVYLVLRRNTAPLAILDKSAGGKFKGRIATVAVRKLENKWVEDALVLYVGKAGPGKTATLRRRVKLYMQFGREKPVGHQGGRYIWQLRDAGELLVCWRPTPDADPRDVEKGLIRDFEATYHNLPFANIYR